MKKAWLWIAMLLLAACGSGAGPNTVSEIKTGQKGTVTVKISDSVAKTVALAPAATKLRLVITNPTLQINKTPFKYIVDGDIPSGNQITGLTFPVANGYIFEIVTYKPLPVGATTTVVNRMLQYAKVTGINVTTAGGTVDLVLQAIQADIALPATVTSGASFAVSARFPSQPTPLQPTWNLFLKTSDAEINTALHSTTPPRIYSTVKAPYVLTEGTLYGQGEFYINNSLLDTAGTGTIVNSLDPTQQVTHQAEKDYDWTFTWPNPDFGDAASLAQALLTVQGITVDIQL